MTEQHNHPIHHKLGLIIALMLFFLSALYTHLSLTANDLSRYALARSLALQGSAEISESLRAIPGGENNIDRAEYDNHTYSDKGPLGGFLGAPIVFAAYHVSGENETFSIWCASLVLSALPLAAIGYLTFVLLSFYGMRTSDATLLSFFLGTGTNLFFWSTLMFSHVMTSALILGSFTLIQLNQQNKWGLLISGMLAGLSVSSDYIAGLFLPPFFLYCLYRFRIQAKWFFAGALIAGIFPAVYHTVLFGHPMSLPYHHLAVFHDDYDYGLLGATYPSPTVLWRNLFGFSHGLFIYNPLLIVLPFFFPGFLKKHRPEAITLTGAMTIYILFDASLGLHQTYAYGNSWGPRYLMPVVALMFIFIAGTGNLKGIRRASIMTLGIISSLLNYYLANLAFMPEPFTAPAALLKFGPEILAQNGGANLFTQSILVRRVLEAHPEHWNAFELLLRDIPALIGDPEKWSTFEYVKPVFGTPVFMSLLITISAPIAAVLVLVWAIKRNQVKTSSEN